MVAFNHRRAAEQVGARSATAARQSSYPEAWQRVMSREDAGASDKFCKLCACAEAKPPVDGRGTGVVARMARAHPPGVERVKLDWDEEMAPGNFCPRACAMSGDNHPWPPGPPRQPHRDARRSRLRMALHISPRPPRGRNLPRPENGVAEWLKMSLAAHSGISAATRVELPDRGVSDGSQDPHSRLSRCRPL